VEIAGSFKNRASVVVKVVKHMPRKREALSSNPNMEKKIQADYKVKTIFATHITIKGSQLQNIH
jgi:hypothetical protein